MVKPLLEILAGVPTVVYGFFAALTVGPLFRGFFNELGAMLVGGPLDGLGQYLMQVQNQMALVAGAVMGIMLIPFVSSLSDDIINAVPQSLRDGSLAMGATKSETVKQVVLPAALPGIMAALLLAMSRAIGETMIVTMAAGLAGQDLTAQSARHRHHRDGADRHPADRRPGVRQSQDPVGLRPGPDPVRASPWR